MKNKKRILALIGVILLVSLYLVAFISSFFVSEISTSIFKASLVCTILVPLVLYSYMMVCRVFRKNDIKSTVTKDEPNDKNN